MILNKRKSWHFFPQVSTTVTIATVKIVVRLFQKQIEKLHDINLDKEAPPGFIGYWLIFF